MASTYTMGFSKAVLASHESRTVSNSASFLLPHLRPSDKILDVGCGPGTITVGFASYVPQGFVTGVDWSPEVVAQAEGRVGRETSNVKFLAGDVLKLPFEDDTFDVVYSHQLFPHLPQPIDALREMRRVCKPNGMVATRDSDSIQWSPSSPGLDTWVKSHGLMVQSAGCAWPPGRHMHVYARKAGFDPERMTVGAGATCYASKEERSWWAGLHADRYTTPGKFRDSMLKSGLTEADCETVAHALKEWAASEDGWYCVLQCENIYRK